MSVMAVLVAAIGVAQPTTVATVVRVVAPETASSIAIVELTAAANKAASWMVDVKPVDVERAESGLAEAVRGCGENNRCVADLLASRDVDQGVYVVANLLVTPAVISVEVIDTKSRRVLAEAIDQVPERHYAEVVGRVVERALVACGHEVGGRLDARITPADAAVTLEPPADPHDVLTVGAYTLRVVRGGFDSSSANFEIDTRQTTRVDLTLEEQEGLLTKWWFWTAVGMVVVGGVTAAVVAAQPASRDTCHPVRGGSC